MTDARTDMADDGDRLPWLEAVEEEDAGAGPSPLKLIAAVVIGLVAIGLVVGGLFWLGNRGDAGGGGEAELIEAPEGEYRVAPGNAAGGMQVEGQGGTAHAASEGEEPRGNLSMRVPERPVAPGQPQPKAGPAQPQTPAQPKAQPPAQPRPGQPPAPAPGPAIQLGAFSSQANAESAWRALAARFRYLAPLSHSVIPVQRDGRTLYRLRASGAGSPDICRRLEVAGEECSVVR